MKSPASFGVIAVIFLSGCDMSASVKMYPTEGPLARQNPVPIIEAEAAGITGNSGDLSFAMPNRASCKGTWSSAAPQFASATWGTMFNTYGGVTGVGTTAGIVPGVNKGQLYAICSDNTRVEGEFVTGSGTANGYGVAKDSGGNVYKLLF